MGVPGSESSVLGGAAGQSSGGGAFYDYQINQSMFHNAGTAMYLSRTFGTATSRDTFTISTWLKRHSQVGTGDGAVIYCGGTSGSQYSLVQFTSDDSISFDLQTTMTGVGNSNEQFRDLNAWYHFVLRIDTTQSTQADRLRVYINGTQLTGYSLGNLSQNEDFAHWNAAEAFYIGQKNGIGHASDGSDLAWAETLFFDGQSYAPTEVAQEKNGVWIPKDPSSLTFGNNGFHLKYAAGAIGTDSSGNGNNFTATSVTDANISLDSPTFTAP